MIKNYGKTEEELLKTGFLVETITEGENIPGKECNCKEVLTNELVF
ncbi:hypothetical protein [Metaclostridioides mangenotii]|nr:hypothetical protein [Clostridioides mangenotii]